MRLKSKIILGVLLLLVGFFAAGGWHLYRTEFAVGTQFDARLYARETKKNGSFTYDDYASTLKDYVDDKEMVAYQNMKEHHKELDAFLLAISQLELETYKSWDDRAKVAFWINAYNALTLKVIVDHYPIKAGLISGLVYPANSIRQIPGVWDKIQFLVIGQKMTLNEIEHGILRSQKKGNG